MNSDSQSRVLIKFGVFAALMAAVAFGLLEYRNELTLENFARNESRIRDFQQQHPALILVAMFLLYVATTALSLPGATVLTLSYAWFFKMVYGEVAGFFAGVVMVSFASTAGATLAFLLSRYLFRETVQRRFGDRLRKFDEALEKDGPFYLFSLRLTPAVPFFVINLVMGLTPIRVGTFWWVSQVGMLAGTCVYVYAGVQIPSAQELAERGVTGILTVELVIAFILLGLFPLVAKKLMDRIRQPAMSKE